MCQLGVTLSLYMLDGPQNIEIQCVKEDVINVGVLMYHFKPIVEQFHYFCIEVFIWSLMELHFLYYSYLRKLCHYCCLFHGATGKAEDVPLVPLQEVPLASAQNI